MLSGLLLNVALYALLRFKMLLAANPAAIAPGPLMVTMGLVSLVFAGFMLYRRRDIKRLFAYSSIEHMGIIAFAFGMGGPLANFAGPPAHGHAQPDQVGDLLRRRPYRAGQGHAEDRRHPRPHRHPPGARLGPGARRRRHRRPAAARHLHERVPGRQLDLRARSRCSPIPLVGGLLIAFGALFLRLNGIAFGEPVGSTAPVKASYVPMFVHLALVFAAGIYLPPPLVAWFQHVARLLG